MRYKKLVCRLLFLGWLAGSALSAHAQDPGFRLAGIGSATIPVTTEKMTNLVFPQPIQTGVKVSKDVLAQKVGGVENVIELKAQRRNFPATNLSVYGRDGRLYSFEVHYTADTPVLNFRVLPGTVSPVVMVSGLPADEVSLQVDAAELVARRRFLHHRVRAAGLGLRLSGVYLRDSLEWLVLEMTNRTQVPFRPGYARYFLRDHSEVRRRAMQEQSLTPVYNGLPVEIGGKGLRRFGLGFSPFTIPRDKRLVIEIAGADGRTIMLTIKGKYLLRARAR
jgi:conjugative transposon TraN protein